MLSTIFQLYDTNDLDETNLKELQNINLYITLSSLFISFVFVSFIYLFY
jgi:hypothetical protein